VSRKRVYCIRYIGFANKEIKKSTLNACWRAVWPEVVERNHVIPARNETFNNILNITETFGKGFENLEFGDIDELFVDQEIDEEELIYMMSKDEKANVESSNDDITNKPNKFTSKDISEFLQLARTLKIRCWPPILLLNVLLNFSKTLKVLARDTVKFTKI
jgi:hypothetical protein